jgi:hypothetical protein
MLGLSCYDPVEVRTTVRLPGGRDTNRDFIVTDKTIVHNHCSVIVLISVNVIERASREVHRLGIL